MTADGEIEPGPYWWKASALTITPTLLANEKNHPQVALKVFVMKNW